MADKTIKIDMDKKYTMSDDYMLRNIAGEYTIIPVGEDTAIQNAMMNPNETAVYLWKQFDGSKNISEVITDCLKEFEADEETITKGVISFVADGLKYGLIKGE